MPSRIIRDSCLCSDTLEQLSSGAESMFFRLTCVADDLGRFLAEPVFLKSKCFPLRADRLDTKDVRGWLSEMTKCGLVGLYSEGGKQYGYFPTWEKYQRVRDTSTSRFPDPPQESAISGKSPQDAAVQSAAKRGETPPRARARGFGFDLGFDSDVDRESEGKVKSPPKRGPHSKNGKPSKEDVAKLDPSQDILAWMKKAVSSAGVKIIYSKSKITNQGPTAGMERDIVNLEGTDGQLIRRAWLAFLETPEARDRSKCKYAYNEFLKNFYPALQLKLINESGARGPKRSPSQTDNLKRIGSVGDEA